MATKLAMTVAVKTIDSQRWICRIDVFQFNETSVETRRCATRRISVCSRHEFFQLREELLPSRVGAAKSLLLIWPEARLLHAQQGPRARWRERKGHHALQIEGCILVLEIPSVG